MIYLIEISPRARKLFNYYYNFIAKKKQQPWNARKFSIAFGAFIYDNIAANPFVHPVKKAISTREEQFRSVNFKRDYKIVYRIDEENKVVTITNIFHNKRHPKKLKAK